MFRPTGKYSNYQFAIPTDLFTVTKNAEPLINQKKSVHILILNKFNSIFFQHIFRQCSMQHILVDDKKALNTQPWLITYNSCLFEESSTHTIKHLSEPDNYVS